MIKISIYDGNNELGSGCLTCQCIHDVEVNKDYRRRGIGTKIAKALMTLGGSWLWVDSSDPVAVTFWDSLGFVGVESRKDNPFVAMKIHAKKKADDPLRAYFAVSIKHSAHKWRFGEPLTLWGYKRTVDGEARCFGGYTLNPDCAELYAPGDFEGHGYTADVVKPEPVNLEPDFCKKYKDFDTVLVPAKDIYDYWRLCGLLPATDEETVTIDGWRSFPENMPPENVTVWIWKDIYDYPTKGYYSHGSWYYTMTGCMVYDGTVTHWMPIPPPPTKPKGVTQ